MQIHIFLLLDNLNMNLMDFKERGDKLQLNVGDSVGGIYKKSKNGEDFWELVEDKINKITI